MGLAAIEANFYEGTAYDLTLVVCLVILADFWNHNPALRIIDGGVWLEKD
jgi:hypothetical protein